MNKVQWADKPQTKGFNDVEHHKFYQCRASVVRAIQAHDAKRKDSLVELEMLGAASSQFVPVKLECTENEIYDMALESYQKRGVWILDGDELVLSNAPVIGDSL